MMECVAVETPRDLLGTVVVSKKGRDKDKPGIIVGWLPGDYALVADGRFRRAARPKKKNMRHLIYMKIRPAELGARILEGEQVTDRMLREGLAAFGEFSGEGRQNG